MAVHVFNDEAWKQHKAEHKNLRAGKRQVHLRKNFYRKGRGGGGGGGTTVDIGLARIVSTVTGKTQAGSTVTFGVGEAVPVNLDSTLGTATFDSSTTTSQPLNPDAATGYEFKIYNFCGAPVPVGKIVHYTAHGRTYSDLGGPMKFIDAEDCG